MATAQADETAGERAGASGPGTSRSAWRFVRAANAHVVIDAADYFELLREAMLTARERIMLLGWDFDTRIRFGGGRRWWDITGRTRYPARLGGFLVWLVRRRRKLRVLMLRWSFGAGKLLLRRSMLVDVIRFLANRRIFFRLDAAHPFGCGHHQKIVVIDDAFASCGGIDMTFARWDTPAHLDSDPRRHTPGGGAHGPWHDLAMLVDGAAAEALGAIARERWEASGGGVLAPCVPRDRGPWPQQLDAEFTDVEIGIARTRAAWREAPEIREVEALFLEHIARARRFIYAEGQYFASRAVAEAMARRLVEPDPPEIVLVTAARALTYVQRLAMDTARLRLLAALRRVDHARRFSTFVPVTASGQPIYVHSKLMIVDDEVLRVGSANMNNRSMGLDSECDLFIDAARPGNAHAASAIARLRHRLLAEHCGMEAAEVAAALALPGGTMAGLVGQRPGDGRRLAPFALRELSLARKAIADSGLLDPEQARPTPGGGRGRRGLFRADGCLGRPD